MSDLPDKNPKTAVGATKIPLDLVPPSVLHALARAFADGAAKYGAYNWREKTISASTYYAAAMRHETAWWDGEDIAPDSGRDHLDHALACIAMLIDAKSIGKLNDNRPPKGAAARMQAEWVKPESEFKPILPRDTITGATIEAATYKSSPTYNEKWLGEPNYNHTIELPGIGSGPCRNPRCWCRTAAAIISSSESPQG